MGDSDFYDGISILEGFQGQGLGFPTRSKTKASNDSFHSFDNPRQLTQIDVSK
jgi:hypothetical protein